MFGVSILIPGFRKVAILTPNFSNLKLQALWFLLVFNSLLFSIMLKLKANNGSTPHLQFLQTQQNRFIDWQMNCSARQAMTELAMELCYFKHNLTIRFNGTNHFENSILYGQLDNDATDKFTRMHGETTVLSIMALDFLLSLNSLVFHYSIFIPLFVIYRISNLRLIINASTLKSAFKVKVLILKCAF